MRAILALGLAMIAVPLAVVGGALVALATFLGLLAGNLRPKEGEMNMRIVLGFMALVGWSLLTICITSCVPKPPQAIVVWAGMSGVLARMTCDTTGNQPVILLNAEQEQTHTDKPFVLLHEQIHVSQMARYGHCQKFIERYRDDKVFAFQMEAEAYCGELEVRVLKGEDRTRLFAGVLMRIARFSPYETYEGTVSRLPCYGGPNEKGEPDTSKVPKHP